jgi:3-oxoacyl-[acyl-carrier-protein] synthase-3
MPSPEALTAPRRPVSTTRAAGIGSVACAVPDTVVRSSEVASRLGVGEDWVVARTGVRERRIAADGERLSQLAAEAGRRALARAGLGPEELDLLLVATMAADELTPNAAPLVAHELGARRAGAFDVGAACTGFLSALAIASGQVESGRAEHVLVIGADILSRLTDHGDRATAALFADGAGAVVAGPVVGETRIGPIVLGTDATAPGAIRASHAERVIRMQGHETFREAVRCLSQSTLQALERAGLELDEVDLFVFHQANSRILGAVGERLGLDPARVVDCLDRYGNTSAATIPIALADAEACGHLEAGATVLLAAFGAGFTWGAGVIRWR